MASGETSSRTARQRSGIWGKVYKNDVWGYWVFEVWEGAPVYPDQRIAYRGHRGTWREAFCECIERVDSWRFYTNPNRFRLKGWS